MILRSKIVCAALSLLLAVVISVSSKISLNAKPVNQPYRLIELLNK